LSEQQFLSDYWQKQPLYMQGAIDVIEPSLSADELGWLATLPDVESRLIFTETSVDRTTYRVQDGPFTEEELASLPERNWTLMVQDVEKHLPDFRQLFAAVNFIPDWRIDDLMVSCAAPGGSVGPHRDNYDVFLCQGTGNRKWTLTDPAAATVDTSAKQLSLLLPFTPTARFLAESGDVLYLPPGVPHWGIAGELCVTYSIGMRAPSKAELESGADRLYGDGTGKPIAESSESIFYADTDLLMAEAEPGRISASTIQRLRSQELLDRDFSDEQLVTVLGSVVTDTKTWLTPDGPTEKEVAGIVRRLAGKSILTVHGMARIAYCDLAGIRLLFANGFVKEFRQKELDLVRELCATRKVCMLTIGRDSQSAELIVWLATKGLFDQDME
jgi:50S ribosomal protein L16 3-hydroxylase